MPLSIEIRPIAMDQWLPDRCLAYARPFKPGSLDEQWGCPSLDEPYTKGDRRALVSLYRELLEEYGCCGFIAWEREVVVAYNNFFPAEIARRVRFYGWGGRSDLAPGILIHNCLSMVRSPAYRRQGIGSALIRRTLDWARSAGWRRFQVHNVLPDAEIAFENDQKSCYSFWRQLGFESLRSSKAPPAVQQAYGLERLFTMAKDLSASPATRPTTAGSLFP